MKKIYKVRNDEGQEFEVEEDRLAEAEKDGFLPIVESIDGDIQRVESKNFSLAEKDGYRPVFRFEEPEISKTESALRGAAQGASFGFADEIEAKLKSLTGNKTYEQLIPEVRQKYDQAAEQNPYSYYGAEIAGGLVVPVPGTSLLTAPLKAKKLAGAAKAASKVEPGDITKFKDIFSLNRLGNMALEGATAGALYGAGASTGEDASKVAEDAATGAIVGAVATPVVGAGLSAVGETLKRAADMPIFGRNIQEVFKLSKKTTKEYLDKVESTVAKLKAEGKSPEEIEKAINKIPDPFGTVRSYRKDQDILRQKAEDIVNELTSPQGTGPLGIVNRRYKQAEILMTGDKIGLEMNEILNSLNETTSTETAKILGQKLLGKIVGVSKTKQTPEEIKELAINKITKQMRNELFNKKNELRKQAIEEAKQALSKAGKDAYEVYLPQIEAMYERDKNRLLNQLYNTLKRNPNMEPETKYDILRNAELNMDESFTVRVLKDKATGNAVYQYTASVFGKPDAKVIQGTFPTKTKYENFSKLSPEEKRKAVLEYADNLLKLKQEAIDEVIKGLKISVEKIDDHTVEVTADVPLSADVVLPNKRLEFPLKEIEKFKKDKLDFNDIQRLKSELSDAIENAMESGNYLLKKDLIDFRNALDEKFNKIVEQENPKALAALKEANALRRNITDNDVGLLLKSKKFNPLSGIVDNSERIAELRRLTERVESLLAKEPTELASSKKTDVNDAKRGLQELIDQGIPEAKVLLDKLEDALETANRVYLGRQMYGKTSIQDATTLLRGFMPVGSLALKGGAMAGEMAARISRSKLGKVLEFLNSPPELYNALSEKVKNPTLKRYLKTMAESDAPKRKALVYTILQNNAFKQELRDEAGIDFEEGE
jgi:hypothetical protein